MFYKTFSFKKSILLLLAVVVSFSCTQKNDEARLNYLNKSASTKPIMRFAVHPLHNPERLQEVFGPLVNYLNAHINEVQFQLEGSVNYPAFEEKIKKREVEFALPNPYQTLIAAQHGYKIFAKMGDDHNFRGIILVRKDSKIKKIADLKGKTISYPAATALAATMMPQYFLKNHGVNVMKEVKNIYVGTQESAILNVYLKTSDAGVTWPPPWKAFAAKNPKIADELEIKWRTETLPNNGLVARNDVPPELVEKVKKIFSELNQHPEGKAILKEIGLSHFESANEQTYESVKKFIDTFSAEVRKPEQE